jgi:hypothetical protein
MHQFFFINFFGPVCLKAVENLQSMCDAMLTQRLISMCDAATLGCDIVTSICDAKNAYLALAQTSFKVY